jgi:AraC-like DNA-binding protein
MADSIDTRPKADTGPTLPAAHALHLAELVERWHVPARQLLGELGLSTEGLSEPGACLPLSQFAELLERARSLTGEPGLGFHLGLKMRVSAHGYLGFAAMTAANLGQALELACRFAPTRTNAFRLRFEARGADVRLTIEETFPLGSVRDTLIVSLLVGLWKIGNAITGQELHGTVDFAFEEPEYFRRFESLLPGRVRFCQSEHRLTFPATLLDLPLVHADPAALRLARNQCEQELEELERQGGLLARVETLILLEGGGYLSLEELAQRISTSPRTLKRRLKEQGTSYSVLLERARLKRAMRLLASGASIDQIAAWLGYSDAANFTRAFRRWTGETPAASRARHPS